MFIIMTLDANCCYAECYIWFIAILSAVMPSVVMLIVIMQRVVAPKFETVV
jgi:hypothetical protein